MTTRRTFLAGAAAASVSALVATPGILRAATTPAQIDSASTLLFVDDHHILYRPATRRVLHRLQRHADNPLIAGGHDPWARDIAYCSVHRDGRTGKYQLWYQAYAGSTARDRTRRCTVCYAESNDGVSWTRPKLNLFDFDGIKNTNIVVIANGGHSDRYGSSVVFDPRDPDPARRYKLAHFDFCRDGSGKEFPGLTVAFSPDGIHWTKHPTAPLLKSSYGNNGEQPPLADEQDQHPWSHPLSISDAFDVTQDPARDEFVAYGKCWIDAPDGTMYGKHAACRTTSKDFIRWTTPQLVLVPDELDPDYVEFHTTPVFIHHGIYFACPQILTRNENNGVMDVELAISRDGQNFARPFRNDFFLARGQSGAFDCGSVFSSASPVILDEEIRFYYGGYSQGATGSSEFAPKSGIGLATLKRDRFAGVRPTGKFAHVTLRPLDLQNVKRITLNADASNGSVRVELLDATARRVRHFTKDDAVIIEGDSVGHHVRWKSKSLLDLPPTGHILRLHLTGAELFALTLHRG